MISEQNFIEWVFSGAVLCAAWIMRRLHMRVDKISDDLTNHKLDVAERYITRLEVISNFKELKSWLVKIDAKLDKKVDKGE